MSKHAGNLRKYLALLALAALMVLVFAMPSAAMAAGHEHYVCGSACSHSGDAHTAKVEFLEWDGTSLELTNGHYYMTTSKGKAEYFYDFALDSDAAS